MTQAQLRNEVRRRAGFRCEYCHFPERFAELRFQLDHVVPRQHGGQDVYENLALACFGCNKHKGPILSGLDPVTRQVTRLFHPRLDVWREHFRWDGARLLGVSATGRAMVEVLRINRPDAVLVREALMDEAGIRSIS